MDFGGDISFLGTSLKVFFIDLLLSGDNAVVIALACRALPRHQMRKAMLVGIVAAVLLRVYLTTVVSFLLDVPCLKLVGSLALIIIAIKLMVDEDEGQQGGNADAAGADSRKQDLWGTIVVIVLADLTMSIDNVVGLAAVAQGSIIYLALGLLLSIPLLMYGSVFVMALLKRYPWLIAAGGALLGWIAGDIAMSDPLIADWVNTQAPALTVFMPVLGALFVLLESRIVQRDRLLAPQPTPVQADTADSAARDEGGELITAVARLAARNLMRKTEAGDATNPVAAAPDARYVPPSAEDALAAGCLILVAEDNPIDQGKLRQTLESLGFAAEFANNGKQAFDRLTGRAYGLLLTDCHMPGMDGYMLTASIRRDEAISGRRLSIIGLIGHDPEGIVAGKCRDSGMDCCLNKAMDRGKMEAEVGQRLPALLQLRRPLDASALTAVPAATHDITIGEV